MTTNYALEILTARQERDATIERARAEARLRIAAAVAERDREIRRLRAEDASLTTPAIAEQVGCSRSQAYEVLDPVRRQRYNARRRAHWHVYQGDRAA